MSSTATSTTSASVTLTFSPRPAPQRSASTDTLHRDRGAADAHGLGVEAHDVAQEHGLVELHLAHRLGDVAVGAALRASTAEARSMWDRITPPKIVPRALVSLGSRRTLIAGMRSFGHYSRARR